MTAPYERPPKPQKPSGYYLGGLIWWSVLVVAVMAIPLISTSIALALSSNPFAQMIVFMLACWVSVWLGMVLVKRANDHDKNHRG